MFRPPIAKEIKEEVLVKVKNGTTVPKAAEEHGINPRTVYGWLSKGLMSEPSLVELNKLKRENQMLLTLVGKLTAELDKQKKGRL